ncbi:MAG: hypothetical protein IJI98_10895, partial [Methanosphaera sp.]|nr:hypothetical protein [Methanosphaera sp.]
MFILIAIILIFIMLYRSSKGEGVYKFVLQTKDSAIEKYAPYSYKTMRTKIKELGLEYTPRQYLSQILIFAGVAGICSWLYFYNIFITICYIIAAIAVIPYITYLRSKRQYSEYIFEQVQVYCTNTIMEFNTTQAFVKSLEG